MARRIVVVVHDRPKKKLGRKWKRVGIGTLLSVGMIAVNSLGVLPFGVFGFIFTAIAATTFVSLFDATYASLTGGDDLLIHSDEVDPEYPDDHYDALDRAN